jgi:hypothetical protein
MNSVDGFLARLELVKQTGSRKWLARCPAHDDKHPSLGVAEADDGRVLVKCWSGCGAAEVIAAVGMSFSDLFPGKPMAGDYLPRIKRPFSHRDILIALNFEMMLGAVALANLANGVEFSEADKARFYLAQERIGAAVNEYA